MIYDLSLVGVPVYEKRVPDPLKQRKKKPRVPIDTKICTYLQSTKT